MSKFDKLKVLDIFSMTKEEEDKMMDEAFFYSCNNPENMSFWLPKILKSSTAVQSSLQIPETKIIPFSREQWNWLRSDNYTPEAIENMNAFFVERLQGFAEGETLFMKTGIFSNKFDFATTLVKDRQQIAKQFLRIFYDSMMVGAERTNEAVFRKYIAAKEDRESIYNGMPLRTELRVFYDFDEKQVVGVSNYWHPEVMKVNLKGQDKEIYLQEESKIVFDFNLYKKKVMAEVHKFMKGVNGLEGKWSVDIMMVGQELWIIDMARMERSALVKQMEEA